MSLSALSRRHAVEFVKLSEQTQSDVRSSGECYSIAAIAAHASVVITPMTQHLLLGDTASMLDMDCCIERTMLAWCTINRP